MMKRQHQNQTHYLVKKINMLYLNREKQTLEKINFYSLLIII